jgi:hypothetical protein
LFVENRGREFPLSEAAYKLSGVSANRRGESARQLGDRQRGGRTDDRIYGRKTMATRQQFLTFSQAKPFVPFTVVLASGTQFTITDAAGASCSGDLELTIHTVRGNRLLDMRLIEIVEPAAAVGPVR